MANWNSTIEVTVTQGGPAAHAGGDFETIMVLTDDLTAGTGHFEERYRIYSSKTALLNDADLGNTASLQAQVAWAQNPHAKRLVIGARFTTANGGAVADEAWDEALQAVHDAYPNWFGFCASTRTASDIETLSAKAEVLERAYFAQTSDANVKSGSAGNAFENISSASRQYTVLIWHHSDSEFIDAGLLGKFFGTPPDSKAAVLHHLQVANVTANDSYLTDTEVGNIQGNNGNIYMSLYGEPVLYPGKNAKGDHFDELVAAKWTEWTVKENLANALIAAANRGERIPFTDRGLQALGGVVEAVMLKGVSIGHFRDYQVTVPLLSEISEADRRDRLVRLEAVGYFANAVGSVSLTAYLSL